MSFLELLKKSPKMAMGCLPERVRADRRQLYLFQHFPRNPVSARRVDPSALVFCLSSSSHRYIINKISSPLLLETHCLDARARFAVIYRQSRRQGWPWFPGACLLARPCPRTTHLKFVQSNSNFVSHIYIYSSTPMYMCACVLGHSTGYSRQWAPVSHSTG